MLSSEVLAALNSVGCTALRVQCYNQKAKISEGFNLGNPDHPMSHLNFFDIGKMKMADDVSKIELWMARQDNLREDDKHTTYVMMRHIGERYGSVHIKRPANPEIGRAELRLKIYPRLIHCMKGIFDQLCLLSTSMN